MANITRFEDIDAWKKARMLSKNVYAVRGPIMRDFGFRDQICRAAISSMSNIAEGFGKGNLTGGLGFPTR